MTIDTIKDVLTRIFQINKNLNEQSLRVLLEASGWDKFDIEEGVEVFRQYISNGGNMDAVKVDEKNLSSTGSVGTREYRPIEDDARSVFGLEKDDEVTSALNSALTQSDIEAAEAKKRMEASMSSVKPVQEIKPIFNSTNNIKQDSVDLTKNDDKSPASDASVPLVSKEMKADSIFENNSNTTQDSYKFEPEAVKEEESKTDFSKALDLGFNKKTEEEIKEEKIVQEIKSELPPEAVEELSSTRVAMDPALPEKVEIGYEPSHAGKNAALIVLDVILFGITFALLVYILVS